MAEVARNEKGVVSPVGVLRGEEKMGLCVLKLL